MKQLKKKSSNSTEIVEVIEEPLIEEIEDDFSDLDVTLNDGLDQLTEEEIDEILDGEVFTIEDEEETLEDFTEEEIQSLTNEIPEELEEEPEEVLELKQDGEFVFDEGPYTFETDQEVTEIESEQSEDLNVGIGAPVVEPEPPVKTETFVDRSNTGSANYRPREIRVVEESVEVKQPVPTPNVYTQDEEENLELLRYKKGPKWQAKK